MLTTLGFGLRDGHRPGGLEVIPGSATRLTFLVLTGQLSAKVLLTVDARRGAAYWTLDYT